MENEQNIQTFEEYIKETKEKIRKLTVIDEEELDSEALATPKVIAKLHDVFDELTLFRDKAESNLAKVIKTRTSYWMGNASNEYYLQHKKPNIIHTKTEVKEVLKSDDIVAKYTNILTKYNNLLKYLEDAINVTKFRGNLISTAVEYRKFVAGL